MSRWTHITACMSVETGIVEKRAEMKKQIKKYLKKAPKITGSEGPADVFVNIPSGYDFYTSHDCVHCKYKDTLVDVLIDGKEYTECDAPDGYDCSGKYQTRIVISVQGDLRDREKEQTEQEFQEFKKYIDKLGYVRDYSVNIEGE